MNLANAESLIVRSIRSSIWFGALAALFGAYYAGWAPAGKYAAFLAWMLANLFIWTRSIREYLGNRRPAILLMLISLKTIWLGVLFLLASKLGIAGVRGFVAFLLGINTPFLVIFLKILGASMRTKQKKSQILQNRLEKKGIKKHTPG